MRILLFILQNADTETHITWPVVTSALSGLLILILAAFASVLWGEVKKLERRLDCLESEIINVKTNYLHRFEELKDHITEKHLKIMEKITILTTLITPNNRALSINKLKKDTNGE